MTEYVLQDRLLLTNWAISVSDGVIILTDTVSSASSEFITRDITNTSDYWQWFIYDGVLSIESIISVVDDSIDLVDSVSGVTWRLQVNTGYPVIIEVSASTSFIPLITIL